MQSLLKLNKYICHTLKVRHGIIRRLDGKKVTGYYSLSKVMRWRGNAVCAKICVAKPEGNTRIGKHMREMKDNIKKGTKKKKGAA